MNKFAAQAIRYQGVLQFDHDVLEATLQNSYQTPTMSPEDMKMTILNLKSLSESHEAILLYILDELAIEPKKKFWQFWK